MKWANADDVNLIGKYQYLIGIDRNTDCKELVQQLASEKPRKVKAFKQSYFILSNENCVHEEMECIFKTKDSFGLNTFVFSNSV